MNLYIFKNNQQLGPYEESAVVGGLRNGSFSPNDLACLEGSKDWMPLSTFFPSEAGSREEPRQPSASYPWMQDSAGSPTEQPRPAGNLYNQPSQPPVPSPQVHHVVYQQVGSQYGGPQGSSLPTIAMSLGIVAMCLMLIGLIPCLGWLNWVTLILAGITNILCWVVVFTEKRSDARNKAVIGLVLTFIAVFIGAIRLILGGGCI